MKMPNAKTHALISGLSGPFTIPACMYAGFPPEIAISCFCGAMATMVPELTPDLDVAHRRFGSLGEVLGFKAYAELVPHRAGMRKKHWSRLKVWNVFFLSHVPILGTLPRAMMVILPLSILFLIFDWNLSLLGEILLGLWIGMSWSDLWHLIADVLSGDLKEISRSFWRHRKRGFYKDKRRRAQRFVREL